MTSAIGSKACTGTTSCAETQTTSHGKDILCEEASGKPGRCLRVLFQICGMLPHVCNQKAGCRACNNKCSNNLSVQQKKLVAQGEKVFYLGTGDSKLELYTKGTSCRSPKGLLQPQTTCCWPSRLHTIPAKLSAQLAGFCSRLVYVIPGMKEHFGSRATNDDNSSCTYTLMSGETGTFQNRGTILRAPIIRTIVFWGLY